MAVIKLQSNFIEFPFEDEKGNILLTLKFDKSDENIKKLQSAIEEVEQKKNELESKEDVSIDELKEFLNQAISSVFGDGAFDKMYEISPSITIVMDYFVQMADGIFNEYNNDKNQEKLNKYLQ